MSSDLRVKKLRGSGGYVMAQVSDEQQRKGNLGGPDLFLAPIGRLDEYTIKKYSCNMLSSTSFLLYLFDALNVISFVPPPLGINPTPTSTSPV